MTEKRILIFDDIERRASRWADQLAELSVVKKNFTLHPMQIGEFEETFNELDRRRREARKNKKKGKTDWNHDLDKTAILIIDYDLLKLNRITYVTAEEVAYLARCYSRCGLIIVLNAYGKNRFDLTLKGHSESFADLNLGDPQTHNPGLWQEPWKGFRPWVWPLLPQTLVAYERRIAELRSALDRPILSFFGLEKIAVLLPRSTVEFIQSRRQKLEETTFRHFVEDSQEGLRPKDIAADDEAVAAIAAARIHKWLERLVLPGQDILVDAPHLVSRFPSLLRSSLKAIATWNEIVTFRLPSKSVLRTDVIEPFRFPKQNWISRPCWFWGELSNCEDIEEVRNPWNASEKADVVFCEDVSAFISRKNAKEFVADSPSPFVRRYVAQVKGVNYQPQVRLAM